jgi:hypothetical protein
MRARAAQIRCSDAERERTAEFLRAHCADGRLTVEELEERLSRAYGARTRGDLEALCADLPRPEAKAPAGIGRRVGIGAGLVLAGLAICALVVLNPLPTLFVGFLGVMLVACFLALATAVLPIALIVGGTAWLVRQLGWPRPGGTVHRLP